MLETIFWVAIFVLSLIALVKGSDWLVLGAEQIGLSLGISPFIAGVIIVGIGTSLPELVSSVIATLQGVDEVVVANAVGSNIANILLVIGSAAVIGRKLIINKDLIDLDLPLLTISAVIFIGVAYDGKITSIEAIILLLAYGVQLGYTITHTEKKTAKNNKLGFLKNLQQSVANGISNTKKFSRISKKDILKVTTGAVGVILGAKYLIDSVIALSAIFTISPASIAIIAVAIGTSLPELVVSSRAALSGKSEVAIGNIFGSNAFNTMVVVGLPGLFSQLTIDTPTLLLGIPTMLLATLLFVISGISKRIHSWEGAMYLIVYLLFIGKIFNLF